MFYEGAELHALLKVVNMGHKHAFYIRVISDFRREVDDILAKFYVHFGMKLCNDQRNAQVFNLFFFSLLPYMFRVLF
jgi:hypothetical protein